MEIFYNILQNLDIFIHRYIYFAVCASMPKAMSSRVCCHSKASWFDFLFCEADFSVFRRAPQTA